MQYSQKIFSHNKKLLYAWFQAMYTRVDLMLYAEIERMDLITIAQDVESEIFRIESFANRFNESSLLSHVNRNAFHENVQITPELFNILKACQLYNEQTNGYFDIAIQTIDFQNIEARKFVLESESCSVRFLHPNLQLDLSGFIKGYALGVVIDFLKEKSVVHALINIGNSSIGAMGNHPAGEGWKIAVPASDCECVLIDECLTTSGNSNTTQWPIINPLTGAKAENKQPVSVITTNPATGEVASKVAYMAEKYELSSIMQKLDARLIN